MPTIGPLATAGPVLCAYGYFDYTMGSTPTEIVYVPGPSVVRRAFILMTEDFDGDPADTLGLEAAPNDGSIGVSLANPTLAATVATPPYYEIDTSAFTVAFTAPGWHVMATLSADTYTHGKGYIFFEYLPLPNDL